jgi:hypothetical protein
LADPDGPLAQAMAEMRNKKVWPFLDQVAHLSVPEFSIPELADRLGLSTNKVS